MVHVSQFSPKREKWGTSFSFWLNTDLGQPPHLDLESENNPNPRGMTESRW
jgi:hypothetical protein